MNYKEKIYRDYVSQFTHESVAHLDYAFSDSKLTPVLRPWVRGIERTAACLDLGCGNGNVLHALKTLGFGNLAGIDISEEQVVLARRVGAAVTQGNILPYMASTAVERAGYFALITLFDVIEHLTKQEIVNLLEHIFAALRPGGVFIAHCPNGSSPFALTVFNSDLTYETLLTETSARHLCTLSGLQGFAAAEHLGASSGLKGMVRSAAWRVMRGAIRALNAIETGGSPRVLTRNFAFKAEKPAAAR